MRAGLLPQDEVAAVKEPERTGREAPVVGDGVNDAPAPAAARTGVSLPLGVAGHEGSTVVVGLDGLRLLADRAWSRPRAGLNR